MSRPVRPFRVMDERDDILVRRFGEARLRADVAGRVDSAVLRRTPMGVDAAAIFRMGILGSGRTERFDIGPGAAENRVLVQGTDRDRRQLVLMVHEPRRRFVEQVSKRSTQVDRRAVQIAYEDAHHLWIERWTDERKRHFLCGTDERQYFICQLPRPVSTVHAAHEVLRPAVVHNRKGKVSRQGEWFFGEPSAAARARLMAYLMSRDAVVHRGYPIGPAYQGRASAGQWGGNPHLTDELVLIRDREVSHVYVRGRVRHVDHNTLRFPDWVEVFRNTERVEANGVARMDGVRWID